MVLVGSGPSAEAAVRQAREDDLPAIVRLLHDDPNGRLREDPSEPLDPVIHTQARLRIVIRPLRASCVIRLAYCHLGTSNHSPSSASHPEPSSTTSLFLCPRGL